MKTVLLFVLLILVSSASAQNYLGDNVYRNNSLDFITDAASIAMGESFVAAISKEKSFLENPAATAGKNTFSAYYNYRADNWNDIITDAKYISAGAAVPLRYGNFGFSFNQYSSGEYVSSVDNGKSTDKNTSIALYYSHNIIRNLSAGVSAKIFNRELTSTTPGIYEISSNNAFLFDAGLIYTFPNLIDTEEMVSDLSLGLSLQNLGTKYEEEHNVNGSQKFDITLPRYLRAGFAYESNLTLGRLSRFEIGLLITGEYKGILNPSSAEKNDVDYWSGGIEATFFKIVSVRAGFLNSPEYSVLFDRKKFNWRYGAGLKIPMAIMGLKHPVVIKFDYAVIPINSLEYLVFIPEEPNEPIRNGKTKNHMYSFGVTLSYMLKN